MKKLSVLLIILFFNISFIFSQTITINIQENKFGIDKINSIIVSQINNIENYTNIGENKKIFINFNKRNFYFNSIPYKLEYSNSYLITEEKTSKQYKLYFTKLPLVFIKAPNGILNEPKSLAQFTYSDDKQILTSNIGIEIRGGYSQNYPKKTYDIEFWEDKTGKKTKNVSFGNLRNDDDWILDALYNEPLRIRSYLASKLWLKIHTPKYIDKEPEAKSGANVKYVEVFLDNKYNGIYNLSEQVDKKQLKLKKFKKKMRGELYKGISWEGATTFKKVPKYNNENRIWSGYEFKYPKKEDITDWKNLYDFTYFVINSSNEEFKNNIWNKFDIDNYSDYFLFLNLIRATDNTGKNIYLAKYKENEPYFYVPWDLDGCFGTIWDGTNENVTNDILTNGFIKRILRKNPDNISEKNSNKWFKLRKTIFNSDTLSNSILKQYNFLKNNKVYERETIIYPNYPFSQDDLIYMLTWLENRLKYLDKYFKPNATYITKNISTNKINFIYPNPAKNNIYISNINSLIGKHFVIYNNLGQLISKDIIKDNFISVKHLKTGYYIITIDGKSYKLIKE